MAVQRVEIQATDQLEARRVEAIYRQGGRHGRLEDEALDAVWRSGRTPVGGPVFVGLTHGSPVLYRFDVPVDTAVR